MHAYTLIYNLFPSPDFKKNGFGKDSEIRKILQRRLKFWICFELMQKNCTAVSCHNLVWALVLLFSGTSRTVKTYGNTSFILICISQKKYSTTFQ